MTVDSDSAVVTSFIGGVNACFCDGSVHFISDFIELGWYSSASSYYLGVWDRLNGASDGETVTVDDF